MYSFRNDYSEGAHPRIIECLVKTNTEQTVGYGNDAYCDEAKRRIRSAIGNEELDVELFVGGTQVNLTAICGRAEDLAHTEMRESFDVVIARAVAALPILGELGLPFVREGGLFCAMKGAKAGEELELAERTLTRLGGSADPEDACYHELISKDGKAEERVIYLIDKSEKTPKKYPRPYAQIKKNPL